MKMQLSAYKIHTCNRIAN